MHTEEQKQPNKEQTHSSTIDSSKPGMGRGLILLAILMVYVAPGVKGTSHLSFSNETVSISRDGCGTSKLCVEEPDDCDPNGSGSCFFTSVNATTPMTANGTHLSFQLSGHSSGYIAVGLTANTSEGTTMLFICGQNSSNNGSFFQTRQLNNSDSSLSDTERTVENIRDNVTGNLIQCEFDVPMVFNTTSFVRLGNGTVSGGITRMFNSILDTELLNLTDPASNVLQTTTAPNTTTVPSTSNTTTVPSTSNTTTVPSTSNTTTVPSTPNTTVHSTTVTTEAPTTSTGARTALHPQALLVLFSVLTLTVMSRA